VAFSSPKADEYLCMPCAMNLYGDKQPEPLTPEQQADIKQAIFRLKH